MRWRRGERVWIPEDPGIGSLLKVSGGGSGGAGPTPVPKTIPGLLWWLRGDSGIAPAGGPVAVWQDQSGAGDPNRDTVQFVTSRQPTWTAADAGYNGQSTLQFASAAAQNLSMVGLWSVAPVNQPYTLVVVGNDGAVGTQMFLGDQNANNWRITATGGLYAIEVGLNLFSTTADSVTKKIFYFETNDPMSTIRISEETAEATGPTASGVLPQLDVGARQGGGNPLNGTIAEVLAYQGLLSAPNRVKLQTYLSTRYAIAVGP
jgi:hypothetical protein